MYHLNSESVPYPQLTQKVVPYQQIIKKVSPYLRLWILNNTHHMYKTNNVHHIYNIFSTLPPYLQILYYLQKIAWMSPISTRNKIRYINVHMWPNWIRLCHQESNILHLARPEGPGWYFWIKLLAVTYYTERITITAYFVYWISYGFQWLLLLANASFTIIDRKPLKSILSHAASITLVLLNSN